MIIAVDFDGTIVEHRFPEIGRVYPQAIEVLKRLREDGHEFILFTCRGDYEERKYLAEALEFCKSLGIWFDSVNENVPRLVAEGFTNKKPYWDMLIDDTAGFKPENWSKVPAAVKNCSLRDVINTWD